MLMAVELTKIQLNEVLNWLWAIQSIQLWQDLDHEILLVIDRVVIKGREVIFISDN